MVSIPDREWSRGAVMAEAVLVLPCLLLISFASIHFLLLSARTFAVQMVANDIATTLSLSLSNLEPEYQLTGKRCMDRCRNLESGNSGSEVLDLEETLGTFTQCFQNCGSTQFLLRGDQLRFELIGHHIFRVGDTSQTGPHDEPNGRVAPGDLISVVVSYPASAILGANVPLLGPIWQDKDIEATSLAVLESPAR